MLLFSVKKCYMTKNELVSLFLSIFIKSTRVIGKLRIDLGNLARWQCEALASRSPMPRIKFSVSMLCVCSYTYKLYYIARTDASQRGRIEKNRQSRSLFFYCADNIRNIDSNRSYRSARDMAWKFWHLITKTVMQQGQWVLAFYDFYVMYTYMCIHTYVRIAAKN